MNSLLLWIAQGFGVGRIPIAPGTFGSLVGVLWFGLLLMAGKVWVLVAGCVAGLVLSVWICGRAEKILRQSDPGSVVLDEIVAMPLCFLGWAFYELDRTGTLPRTDYLFSHPGWVLTLTVFAAFRFFDVVKPWPVNRSQALHGGLGVTADDAVAAVYVNALVVIGWALLS